MYPSCLMAQPPQMHSLAGALTAKNPFLLISVVSSLWTANKMLRESTSAARFKHARGYDADVQLSVNDKGETVMGVDGKAVMEEQTVEDQSIVQGPMASQVAIKMFGTNGGGYANANAAHPFENPTPLSNFLQMLALLCIGSQRQHRIIRQTGAILPIHCPTGPVEPRQPAARPDPLRTAAVNDQRQHRIAR